MTDFERAKIKIKAWKAIQGWGITVKTEENIKEPWKDISTPWNWEERMRRADELTEWAISHRQPPE